MSEQQHTEAILLVRVKNGFAIYNGASMFDYANGRVNVPIAVEKTAVDLGVYVQGWGFKQEAKHETQSQ